MVKALPIDQEKTYRRKSVQAIWQCSALVVLSVLLALTINQFRTDRLALIGDWSVESRLTTAAGERMDIPLAEAETLFAEKRAVFLDADLGKTMKADTFQVHAVFPGTASSSDLLRPPKYFAGDGDYYLLRRRNLQPEP